MSFLVRLFGAALASALSAASFAQTVLPPEVDPQSLRRPRATWNQADREFGFANWDRIFPARIIARGKQVHPLPEGPPLPTFSPGGEGATQLQRNVDAAYLAGIVVLHDGKLRLERYALGHSATVPQGAGCHSLSQSH